MPEQEITVKVDVPEGWEIDGDPKSKAIFDLGNTVRYELFVMYKRLPPHQWPECFPEGAWVYRDACGAWQISNLRPVTHTGGHYRARDLSTVGRNYNIHCRNFCAAHGQTFVPPPDTRCVQVTRT